MVVGHVAPEAAVGGIIAFVNEGDLITIDADRRLLQLEVSDEVLERRRNSWRPRKQKYTSGVLMKYAKLVSSSSLGAVTDYYGTTEDISLKGHSAKQAEASVPL